jgi:16S rRNA (guanine966-N2)-methyltransferase
LRITGGEWRSRRLRGPGRTAAVRPTPDAMRERAFAVLGDRVRDARVLDLFAGTGAVGLEALSRGAAAVVFVERHAPAAAVLRANRKSFELDTKRATILVRNASAAVDLLARQGDHFDLAWVDPPFESWAEGLKAVVAAFAAGLLEPEAIACLECPAKADVAGALPGSLEVVRDLAGGASRVVMIRRVGVGTLERWASER